MQSTLSQAFCGLLRVEAWPYSGHTMSTYENLSNTHRSRNKIMSNAASAIHDCTISIDNNARSLHQLPQSSVALYAIPSSLCSFQGAPSEPESSSVLETNRESHASSSAPTMGANHPECPSFIKTPLSIGEHIRFPCCLMVSRQFPQTLFISPILHLLESTRQARQIHHVSLLRFHQLPSGRHPGIANRRCRLG